MHNLKNLPLGKASAFKDQYDSSLLFPIARTPHRQNMGININTLPFKGFDIWNAYEVSWLNVKGKPEVRICQIILFCNSEFLIESKSLKLYLNSYSGTKFSSAREVEKQIAADLSSATNSKVMVTLIDLDIKQEISKPSGVCIDEQDIEIPKFEKPSSSELKILNEFRTETLYSELMKSNCPVTGQPDWATVMVTYSGQQIDPAGLLRYIISFRNCNELHEECVERIFCDIMEHCKPEELTVYARYTRRGGIDINPIRSTRDINTPVNLRFIRQ